jgi:L-fuculokinase
MQNVYLIYDIGKTNKKVLLFDEQGNVLDEYSEQFAEITDEDGFACDDIEKISEWVLGQYELINKKDNYKIKAINFATYGASFVHINNEGKVSTPLYNYLKPIPEKITTQFLNNYFDSIAEIFSLHTASPLMGMLNSGLQLYWLKHTQPHVWNTITHSLHLPQYLHYLFTKQVASDYTSIGCHTGLYIPNKKQYHPWVFAEEIDKKLAPINTNPVLNTDGIYIGTGLHDSSAALIPYLNKYKEPFILISTGTWCINLNPFTKEPLTVDELRKDCLNYLQVDGNPVKASRIFLGKEHEMQCKRIGTHFNVVEDFYKTVLLEYVTENNFTPSYMEGSGPQPQKQLKEWDLFEYPTPSMAYNVLIKGLVLLLQQSIELIDDETIHKFYIDGGFASNQLFHHYLQEVFPHKKIIPVEFPQATALGTYLHVKNKIALSLLN